MRRGENVKAQANSGMFSGLGSVFAAFAPGVHAAGFARRVWVWPSGLFP